MNCMPNRPTNPLPMSRNAISRFRWVLVAVAAALLIVPLAVHAQSEDLAAPSNLTATIGDEQLILDWTDPGNSNITKYQISTDGGSNFINVECGNSMATRYTATGLTNGTSYTFQVRAYDESGPGASATVTATPLLRAPTELVAWPGDGYVQLRWKESTDSRITGYEVNHEGTYYRVTDQGHESETFGYSIYKLADGQTDLTNGTNYTIKVRAVNGKAATLNATPVIPAMSIRATPGYGWVTLSWRDRGDSRIKRYQFSSDDGANYTSVASTDLVSYKVNNLDFLKYKFTSLTNGTSYTFKVRAADADDTVIGAVSPPDTEQYDPLTATPLFLAPSNLTAAPGASQVTLSWDDPETTEISKYQLKIGSGAFTDIPNSGAITEHTVTGLTYSTYYTFELRAYDSSAAGPSAAVAAYPVAGPTVPPPPDNLQATPADSQVTLTWDDPGDNSITRYEVSSDGGASYSVISGSGASTTSHTVTGLANLTGSGYTFAVRAVNASGAGAPSKAWAEPGVVPGDVVDLPATVPAKHERVELSWNDPTTHDRTDGYKVRYKKTTDNAWGEWKLLDNPGGTPDPLNELTIYNLENNVSYDFEVLAYNYIGDGPTSSRTATPVPEVPTAPTNVITTPGDGEVTLTWDDPPADEKSSTDGYKVSFNGFKTNRSTDKPSYTYASLTNGTTYSFEVRANNSAGDSLSSEVKEATPLFAAPKGLQASPGGRQVKLTWDDPGDSSISGYEVSSNDGADYTPISGSDVDTTEHTVTGLTGGTEQTFAVRAVNGAATMVDATPLFALPADLSALVGDQQITLNWTAPGNPNISGYEVSSDDGTNYTPISDSDDTTNSHLVQNLTNGTEYSFAVRAVNCPANGVAAMVSETPLFDAPTGLTATAGNEQMTLTWDDPGNSSITGYEASSDGGGNYTAISGSDKDTNSHIVQNLSNGTSYTFAVRAENGAAAMVDATPLFAAPAGLSATAGDGQVRLDWTDPFNSNISKYQVKIDNGDFADILNSDANTISHTATGLTNGTTYTFAVRAVNASLTGAAAMVNATPRTPPPPPPVPGRPGNLTATPDDRAVALSWTAAANNGRRIIKYQHRRSGVGWDDVPGGPAATKVTVSGLTNGVEYVFYVRAVSSAGSGARASVRATPASVPDAPSNLTATADDEIVVLTWVGAEDNGSPIIKYQHQRDGAPWKDVTGGATANSLAVTGLTNGVEYVFYVRAVNSAGNGVPASVRATPASVPHAPTPASVPHAPTPASVPDAPSNLTATADDEIVVLTWVGAEDNGSPIIKYQHQRDGAPWEDVGRGATANFLASPGLTNGVEYVFYVRAVNSVGNGVPALVRATPASVPDAPSNLTATADDEIVVLTWVGAEDNGSPIIKYQHQRDGAPWEDVGRGATANFLASPGLTNGVEYVFYVRAINGVEYVFYVRAINSVGNGVPASVRATPASVPDAPGNLTATADDEIVVLTWVGAEDNGSPIIKYQHQRDGAPWEDVGRGATANFLASPGLTNGVEYVFYVRAVNSVGNGVPALVRATPASVPDAPSNLTATADDEIVVLTWVGAEDNGSPIIKYQHQRDGAPWEDVGRGATANFLASPGLTNGVEYVFYVRAINSVGNGVPASVRATPASVPDAPGNLTATAYDGAIALNWTAAEDNGSPIIKYQHQRDGAPWEDVGRGATANFLASPGLTNGVEYVFYVRAINSVGNGVPASVRATPASVPDAPGNLTATAYDGAIALNWTAAEDNGSPIIKYQHQRDGAPWEDVPGGATANSLGVTGLVNDTRHTFSVRAVNDMGEGAVASVAGPTPRHIATPTPGLTATVVPRGPLEPTSLPSATPAGTPVEETPSRIPDSPLVPVGIALFALPIAAFAAFILGPWRGRKRDRNGE